MCAIGAIQFLEQRELIVVVTRLQRAGAIGPRLDSIQSSALSAGTRGLTDGDQRRKRYGTDRATQMGRAVHSILVRRYCCRGSRSRILATVLSIVASIHFWSSTTVSKLRSAQPRHAKRLVRRSMTSSISVPAS